MNYIHIEFISHALQRYDTCGDWQFKPNGDLTIRVSDTGNHRANCLIALHELVEALLCNYEGITTEQVDEFDLNWKGDGEPGDDEKAPYYNEHQAATDLERRFASFLGLPWSRYEQIVNALTQN